MARQISKRAVATLTNGAEVAEAILTEHNEIQQAGRSMLLKAKSIGDRLLAQKESLAHGEWGPWLAEYLPQLTQRHVTNYLRVAANWDALPGYLEQGQADDLSLRGALNYLAEAAKEQDGVPSEEEVLEAWSHVANVTKQKGRYPYKVEGHISIAIEWETNPWEFGSLKALWQEWQANGDRYVEKVLNWEQASRFNAGDRVQGQDKEGHQVEGVVDRVGIKYLKLEGGGYVVAETAVVVSAAEPGLKIDRLIAEDLVNDEHEEVQCSTCQGSGWADAQVCWGCGGMGVVEQPTAASDSALDGFTVYRPDTSSEAIEEGMRLGYIVATEPEQNGNAAADLAPTEKVRPTAQERMHARLSKADKEPSEGKQPSPHDENNTPQWVWQPLLDAWGRAQFDLDVATNEHSGVPARLRYTKDNSALDTDVQWQCQPADGQAETLGWNNCPYSLNEDFSRKFAEQYELGQLPTHFFVLNKQDSRTAWHKRYLTRCDATCRLHDYVKFEVAEGGDRAGATFSLEVFYFGPDVDRFVQAMEGIGTVMLPAAKAVSVEVVSAEPPAEVAVLDGNGDRISVGDVLLYKAGGVAGVVKGFTDGGRCRVERGGQDLFADGAVCVIDPVGLG